MMEELVMNHTKSVNNDAEYIVSLALGYQASQILSAAINLDIFTILESGAKNISEITLHLETCWRKRMGCFIILTYHPNIW